MSTQYSPVLPGDVDPLFAIISFVEKALDRFDIDTRMEGDGGSKEVA